MARERAWTVVVPPRVEKVWTAALVREQRRLREALDEFQGGLAGDVKKLR